jgi:hypothetical protein
MKTWLTSFQVEQQGLCFDEHFLLQAGDEHQARWAACIGGEPGGLAFHTKVMAVTGSMTPETYG